MTDQAEQHDAFREQRKTSLYWLRKATDDLETLELVENILPQFVRWRNIISNVSRNERMDTGALDIHPVGEVAEGDVAAADALHADVTKLFDWLLGKRHDNGLQGLTQERPSRRVVKYSGLITYDFRLTGLPGFEGGLSVTIAGLPAGSACRITQKVTGYRMVKEAEYEMVCDDEPGISPEERAEEAEREAVQ